MAKKGQCKAITQTGSRCGRGQAIGSYCAQHAEMRHERARDAVLREIEAARRELVELSTRTRLLNTPRHRSRVKNLEIVDELSEQVFKILVHDGRTMTFLPRTEPVLRPESEESDDLFLALPTNHLLLSQPEDDDEEVEANGTERPAPWHTDTKLQTELRSEILQRRLLSLFYDSRTGIEERGINTLFLAVAFLRWYERESSDRELYAPLILLPVTLVRASARSRFKLSYSDEDLFTNLSLKARLKLDFGIALPDLPDSEDLSPESYFQLVADAVSGFARWEVLPNDIVLGVYSYAKFLMWADLDSERWPQSKPLGEGPLITGILGEDGFGSGDALYPEDTHLDDILEPSMCFHVMDADSSQALAIEEVRRGRSLVIQGPPGTGKSQTITNLIATAVMEGQTVLFVSEKLAALEVVKRRMDTIGLGDMCLELHSHKARKKQVLEDLSKTLDLGRPATGGARAVASDLKSRRDRLNEYASALHTLLEPSGLTPYRVAGLLTRLGGLQPPDFRLSEASRWTGDEIRRFEGLVRELAAAAAELGIPNQAAWRGAQVAAVLPADLQRLQDTTSDLLFDLKDWQNEVGRFGTLLDCPHETWAEIDRAFNLAVILRRAPTMDRSALGTEPWRGERQDILRLLEAGARYRAAKKTIEGVLHPEAWETDLSAARRALAERGRSLLRWFASDYRAARKAVKQAFVQKPPVLNRCLDVLDAQERFRASKREIERHEGLGKQAFGDLWARTDSSWDLLASVVAWVEAADSADLPTNYLQVVARLDDVSEVLTQAEPLENQRAELMSRTQQLLRRVKLDLQQAFGVERVEELNIQQLCVRLDLWDRDPEGLHKWIAYRTCGSLTKESGLTAIETGVYDGSIDPSKAVVVFQYAYCEQLMRQAYELFPVLRSFDGRAHERLIAEFRDLDLKRIELARAQVAAIHHEQMPSGTAGVGEMGLILGEIAKKRRHLPLRQLISRAGRAIQRTKPVFMMSPMSVAKYLKPGSVDFDLLIFDEASQIEPADAMGAIARARQMVVVGDDKQLPPTPFFRRIGDEDWGEDDPEATHAGDLESILGLSVSKGMPSKMLLWHYRSQHESLIAVSNKNLYRSKLFIPPTPTDSTDLGLDFHYCSDGIYDRGRSRRNAVEAQCVAAAVMRHARSFPELSLGVGTFSISQRDAILDELELLRRESPETEVFFRPSGPEPFFVKNLESVQGDERDIIFVSVGYGRDRDGYMHMNFGPVSAEGGHRRLNVLITRARRRCEVFSSIKAADIDLDRARGFGVRLLKEFLQYAELGVLDVAAVSEREPDSPFEEEVGFALTELGFDVDYQVGMAGFFIDLAVRHPDHPGQYVLGIECDGASYHSARSARDRDRLRQGVLEARGWTIHRIWSSDWFRRPKDEVQRAVAAIVRAKVKLAAESDPEPAVAAFSNENQVIQRTPARRKPTSQVGVYCEADFVVKDSRQPHELPVSKMVRVVEQIVEIEGPIHSEEIARRVSTVCGCERSGSRIRRAAQSALRQAVRERRVRRDGDFYMPWEKRKIVPRDRSETVSLGLRKPKLLPPPEIRAALAKVIGENIGVELDDAMAQSARLLGFKRTGSQLREVIQVELRSMLYREELRVAEGRLYLGA